MKFIPVFKVGGASYSGEEVVAMYGRNQTLSKKTVFVFPGNATHHSHANNIDNSALFAIKGGGGLAVVSEDLGKLGFPTLSLPTTGMERYATDDNIKQIVQGAVRDVWRAIGAGFNIALPMREHKNQNYFTNGLYRRGNDNVEMEPAFWGQNQRQANPSLAKYYIDRLLEIKKYLDADGLEPVPAEFQAAFDEGASVKPKLEAVEAGRANLDTIPAWFAPKVRGNLAPRPSIPAPGAGVSVGTLPAGARIRSAVSIDPTNPKYTVYNFVEQNGGKKLEAAECKEPKKTQTYCQDKISVTYNLHATQDNAYLEASLKLDPNLPDELEIPRAALPMILTILKNSNTNGFEVNGTEPVLIAFVQTVVDGIYKTEAQEKPQLIFSNTVVVTDEHKGKAKGWLANILQGGFEFLGKNVNSLDGLLDEEIVSRQRLGR